VGGHAGVKEIRARGDHGIEPSSNEHPARAGSARPSWLRVMARQTGISPVWNDQVQRYGQDREARIRKQRNAPAEKLRENMAKGPRQIYGFTP
jgi:hypothetical protein